MDISEIEACLNEALSPDEVKVTADGSHYVVLIVAEGFDGQSKVKRQQAVYAPLMDKITDGTLHAMTIKAFTPAEWQKQKIFHS